MSKFYLDVGSVEVSKWRECSWETLSAVRYPQALQDRRGNPDFLTETLEQRQHKYSLLRSQTTAVCGRVCKDKSRNTLKICALRMWWPSSIVCCLFSFSWRENQNASRVCPLLPREERGSRSTLQNDSPGRYVVLPSAARLLQSHLLLLQEIKHIQAE